ncbi:XdhC family protein [Rhizobium sp. BR 317]|uniref:XdhC family protein n=1 Tax=Rhizobium sp. BR 317 TaxID=3040015 RepID=UPI0039BF8255
MDEDTSDVLTPAPVRALTTDDTIEILGFASACLKAGSDVVLATLVEIRGGAARALGSHMVVAADGRFCGYVSGGCVEAAVACEALLALVKGCDRIVTFGDGSPFFDIVLPCGGGITIALHLLKDGGPIEEVLRRIDERRPAGLRYCRERQSLQFMEPPERAGWQGGDFLTNYRPRTRVVISGHTVEASAVACLAAASQFDVLVYENGEFGRDIVRQIDTYTAILFLHHDLDREESLLRRVLGSPAFYVGALGSTRTHRKRVERLKELGYSNDDIARIKAPIGIFGPTRDAYSLALSVMADVVACRLAIYG